MGLRTGFAAPFTPDGRGSFRMLSGDPYVEQCVRLGLEDCDSDNPFQESDIGIGDRVIFGLSDSIWKRFVVHRVKTLFDYLKADQLAEFVSVTWEKSESGSGLQVARVTYRNLETDKTENFPVDFGRSS